MRECTEQEFLKDIAEHKMTVLLDNGPHRCLRFAASGERSWFNWFMITTWPGYLAISGDMGSFVFCRLEDMFTFFRPRSEHGLDINPSYWEEKCEAADRHNGTEQYDADKFRRIVREVFDEFWNERSGKGKKKLMQECWQEIQDQVLCAENEYEAHQNTSQFEYSFDHPAWGNSTFEFNDFWEHNLKSYTYRYLWCCYAIVWGIRQYDSQIGRIKDELASRKGESSDTQESNG
jgi:hypothetical protein